MTNSEDEALERMLREHYGETQETILDDDEDSFLAEADDLYATEREPMTLGLTPPTIQMVGIEQGSSSREAEVGSGHGRGPWRARLRKNVQRPFTIGAVAGTLALAASFAGLFLHGLMTSPRAPTGALVPSISGGVADVRAEPNSPASRRFELGSTIEIRFSQALRADDVPIAGIRAFTSSPGGALIPISARVTRVEEGDEVRLSVEIAASALGKKAGPKQLVLVLGGPSSDLPPMDGLHLSELRSRTDVRVIVEDVDLWTPE